MKYWKKTVTRIFNSGSLVVIILVLLVSFSSIFARNNWYLFDDFNYESVKVYKNIDSSGSIFSRNIWKSDFGDTALKAWFKWNCGDREFAPNSEIVRTHNGFILNMKPSSYHEDDLQPMLHSTFCLKYGTYASLCKFSKFDERDKITQAFWLASPVSYIFKSTKSRLQYRDEIDFEWNNWWFGDGKHNMSVGSNNRNFLRPNSMNLNFVARDTISYKGNSQQINIPFLGEPVITDCWGLCIFVIDSINNSTKFGIYFPSNGRAYEIWAGDNNEWGSYFTINNYSAYHLQNVIYSIGTAQDDVHADSPFEVDWFYYNERTDLDYPEIIKIVDSFKTQKINRIFSGDIFFNEIEILDNKDNFWFAGDTTIEPDKEYKWFLQSECKRWYGAYYMKEMKYRFHNKGNYWEDWNPLVTIEPTLKASNYQDSLEIFASFSEYWSKYKDSARIKVSVKSTEEAKYKVIHNVQVFPNPFKEYSLISFSLSEDSNIKLKVADLLGNEVYSENSFKKSGRHTKDLSNFNLAIGLYICLIYTENQTESVLFFRR